MINITRLLPKDLPRDALYLLCKELYIRYEFDKKNVLKFKALVATEFVYNLLVSGKSPGTKKSVFNFMLRAFSSNLDERISKIEESNLQDYKKIVERIFEENKDEIKNGNSLSLFRLLNHGIVIENYEYRSLNPRKFLSFDSTQLLPSDFVLASLVDKASTCILDFLIEIGEPKGNRLSNWLSQTITGQLLEEIRNGGHILFDLDKTNPTKDVLSFFYENNIPYVFATKLGNQLSESINRIIKVSLKEHRFLIFPEVLKFEDLPDRAKITLISAVIKIFNNYNKSTSQALAKGETRMKSDTLRLCINKVAREILNEEIPNLESLIEDKSDRKKYYLTAISCFFKISLMIQFYGENINNPNKDIDEQILTNLSVLPTPSNFIEDIIEAIKNKDFGGLIKIKSSQQEVIKFLNNNNVGLSDYAKLSFTKLKDLRLANLMERLRLAETDKEKLAIETEFNKLIWDITAAAKNERNTNEIESIITISNETSHENEKFHKRRDVEYIDTSLGEVVKRNNPPKNTLQLKKLSFEAYQARSVMPEDFPFIVKVCRDVSNKNKRGKYTEAKYMLAHVLLILFGIRTQDLNYFNIKQLDNLFSQKDVQLYCKKAKQTITFPYVKEFEKYLNIVRNDYLYIKECQKNNSEKLTKITYDANTPYENQRSEIWSGINASNFIRTFNNQLEKAAELISPTRILESSSYRRGFHILVAKILGMRKMGIINIYEDSYGSVMRNTIKSTLEKIHGVSTSKDIVSILSPQEEKETLRKLENLTTGNKLIEG
uniref:Uncharacterized protein n=1 Tax=Cryptoglena skujai TaxID=161229 RepID=A0A0G3SK51_9EUGL|nr:hypothetical protein [Cryptoglena skujai]AKL38997.1 hypothetical protein [Cryptoglena skujai]